MEYPVFLRRKRVWTVVFNAAMFIISVVATAVNIASGGDYAIFAVASVLFLLTLSFNAYFGTEKTYAIYEDRIVTVSKFLPKAEIKAENLAGVEYTSERKEALKVNYNTEEFDLEALSGGSAEFLAMGEGMWCIFIAAKDINRPLAEVKLLIEGLKKN